jgi:hypothetical protein
MIVLNQQLGGKPNISPDKVVYDNKIYVYVSLIYIRLKFFTMTIYGNEMIHIYFVSQIKFALVIEKNNTTLHNKNCFNIQSSTFLVVLSTCLTKHFLTKVTISLVALVRMSIPELKLSYDKFPV